MSSIYVYLCPVLFSSNIIFLNLQDPHFQLHVSLIFSHISYNSFFLCQVSDLSSFAYIRTWFPPARLLLHCQFDGPFLSLVHLFSVAQFEQVNLFLCVKLFYEYKIAISFLIRLNFGAFLFH